MRRLALLALVGLSSACHSIPKADAQADAQAKTFETRADWCGVYIFRSESYYPSSALELELDGDELGPTAPGTFRLQWLGSGQHELVSRSENEADLVIDAKPGTLIYVWQEVKMGSWTPSSIFHIVDEAKGQAGVRSCLLLAPDS